MRSPVQVRALGALFVADGFRGNTENYYDHRNSLLEHVLASRRGIPISLAVLFAAVCARVGVPLDPIGLPGHFLLATRPLPERGRERVFVDVFHECKLLDLTDCQSIVARYGIRWNAEMAAVVRHTEVWERMLRNLHNCHQQVGDTSRAYIVQHMLAASQQLRASQPNRQAVRTRAPSVPYPHEPAVSPQGATQQHALQVLQEQLPQGHMPEGQMLRLIQQIMRMQPAADDD